MKVTVDIDCTPIEARQFFGLPDITPLQEKMMKIMEDQMLEHLRSLDPETFVRTWMPVTLQNWSDMQKMFWSQMGMDMGTDEPKEKKAAK
jgi:hypothetical protein